jgi:hypothetical protein
VLRSFATEEFVAWYARLPPGDLDAIHYAVELLSASEGELDDAYDVRTVDGTSFPLRELRVGTQDRPFRLFFVVDLPHLSLLLLGGDRTAIRLESAHCDVDTAFYAHLRKWTERIWREYLDHAREHSLPPPFVSSGLGTAAPP